MARIIALGSLLVFVLVNASTACDRCGQGGVCCEACQLECCPCEMVQKTIMVPCTITETRMKVQIVKTTKDREETYTVFQCVPKKQTFTKECCYMETEVKSKEITCEQCRRVQQHVVFEDKVTVPGATEYHQEMRCREEGCCLCPTCVSEPCTCKITRGMEVPRVQECERPGVVFEETKKTIDYCVQTPKFEKKECGTETVYELVPVTKTRKVQVCVPEAVKVPVDVKVMKMVPKEICVCKHCWCEIERLAAEKAACKDCKKEHFALFKKDK